MAKMFYTQDEVAQKLGKSAAEVKQMADDGSLQVFRDGEKMMFKCTQVDGMAGDRITLAGDGDHADARGGTDPDLTGTGITIFDSDQIKSTGDSAMGTRFGSRAGASMGASGSSMILDVTGKNEPVKPIAAPPQDLGPAKVSVFDPDEVREADSMAATHANVKIKDEDLALESVGSGSGLLDLTRETDDTSLGAELLDEIYPSNNTESQDIKMDTAAIGSTGIFDSNLRSTAKVQHEAPGIGEGSGSAFGSLSDTGSAPAPAFSAAAESSFGASLASADTGMSSAVSAAGSKAGNSRTGSGAGPAPTKSIVTPSSLQMVAPVEYAEEEDPTGNLFMSGTLALALIAAVVSLFAIIPSLQGITGKITDTLSKDNMQVILFGAMFVIALILGILGLVIKGKKQTA